MIFISIENEMTSEFFVRQDIHIFFCASPKGEALNLVSCFSIDMEILTDYFQRLIGINN